MECDHGLMYVSVLVLGGEAQNTLCLGTFEQGRGVLFAEHIEHHNRIDHLKFIGGGGGYVDFFVCGVQNPLSGAIVP